MIEQYPREISLDEFFERREERLLMIDADIAQPVFEVVAELDPDSPVQAVSCFGYFEEWTEEEQDDTYEGRMSILYEDHDSDFETVHFRDGYWRSLPGRERLAVYIDSELIPAIGGYVLQPDRDRLANFTDRMGGYTDECDESDLWRPGIGVGTNNRRNRMPASREYDCQMRDRW